MAWGSAVDHNENFPVASLLCPPAWRGAVRALYRLARWADDVADEGHASPSERLQRLQALRAALLDPRAAAASVTDATLAALVADWQRAQQQHGLPQEPVLALLEAFEQDVRWRASGRRYADEAELLDYCRRSANPIGRLLLHLAGQHDPAAQAESDAICSALQLINLWQDLGPDVARGRWYLPDAWLLAHGLDPQRPPDRFSADELAPVVLQGCALARSLLRRGWALPLRLDGRFGWELRLVLQGGLRVLQRIEALRGRTLLQRPRLHPMDLPRLLWRAVWHRPPAAFEEIAESCR
ncbi:squalene synthase HpnC [Tepidimonas sp.]|uniref:squalene synthase HpnC n=1 Tax=Tepidimonas sp. TaxID=2002775 RepID=UPI00298F3153|nr:squalene synthase HpnC [Tepidimonas sp.]